VRRPAAEPPQRIRADAVLGVMVGSVGPCVEPSSAPQGTDIEKRSVRLVLLVCLISEVLVMVILVDGENAGRAIDQCIAPTAGLPHQAVIDVRPADEQSGRRLQIALRVQQKVRGHPGPQIVLGAGTLS